MITTIEYLKLYKKYPGQDNPYDGWEKDLSQIKAFNKELLSKYPWLEPRNNWSGKKILSCVGEDGEEGFWPDCPEKHPEYDYEYTHLDDMPDGWRIAFGDQMCEEIHQELVKYDFVDRYAITQIKEKYGALRWYDNGTPIGRLSKTFRSETRKLLDGYPEYDRQAEWCHEDYTDHYISMFDKNVDMPREEIEAYNKDAIVHYSIYTIEERCQIPSIIDKYERLSAETCIKCGEPAKWISMGWISPYCNSCATEGIKSKYLDWNNDTWGMYFTPIDKSY